MEHVGEVFSVAYAVVCFGIFIYLVVLASRFVKAHERMAVAVERIERKQQGAEKKL